MPLFTTRPSCVQECCRLRIEADMALYEVVMALSGVGMPHFQSRGIIYVRPVAGNRPELMKWM